MSPYLLPLKARHAQLNGAGRDHETLGIDAESVQAAVAQPRPMSSTAAS